MERPPNWLPIQGLTSRRALRVDVWLQAVLSVCMLESSLSTVTIFSISIPLSTNDTSWEGADLVINNTTITINGLHASRTRMLSNFAVFTHSLCTATRARQFNPDVTETIAASADSRIDLSRWCYLASRTRGNTTVGASTGHWREGALEAEVGSINHPSRKHPQRGDWRVCEATLRSHPDLRWIHHSIMQLILRY